jgi:hypothetical protein
MPVNPDGKTYEDILQYVVEGIDVDKDVNE